MEAYNLCEEGQYRHQSDKQRQNHSLSMRHSRRGGGGVGVETLGRLNECVDQSDFPPLSPASNTDAVRLVNSASE